MVGGLCPPKRKMICTAHIAAQFEWGLPVDYLKLRLIAKAYFRSKRIIQKCKQNMTSDVRPFVKMNKHTTQMLPISILKFHLKLVKGT